MDTTAGTASGRSRMAALGIASAVLFAVGYVLVGNQPSGSASTATVAHYFTAHRGQAIAAVFAIALSMAAFGFFVGALRDALSRTSRVGDRFAAVIGVGGAVYMVGALFMALTLIALTDAAHHNQAAAVQTINVLNSDGWVPVVIGISVTALAAGAAMLQSDALPRWLGWVSIVLGIVAIAGPAGAIAFLLMPVWTLVTSICLLRAAASQEQVTTFTKQPSMA